MSSVAGGSDAPIEIPNPLWGMHAGTHHKLDAIVIMSLLTRITAIYRRGANGQTWRPEECLTFEEALQIYTQHAAYACYSENELGKIGEDELSSAELYNLLLRLLSEVGYGADFVVVDRDVAANPELLLEAKMVQVWVAGRLVRGQFAHLSTL